MILTPGTISDQDLQPDAPRVCPQCHRPMQAVVIVIAITGRRRQSMCVSSVRTRTRRAVVGRRRWRHAERASCANG